MKPNFQNNQSNQPNSGAAGANRKSGNFRGRFQRRKPKNAAWNNANATATKTKQTSENTTTLPGVPVMIALSEFPKDVLTDEQLNLVQEGILNLVDGTKGTEIKPQFWECKKDVGSLIMRCNNTTTVDWLKEILPQSTILEGQTLKVIDSIPNTTDIFKVIVPSNYPINFFTTEQLDKLNMDILKEIDKISDGSFVPQFLNCTKDAGALKFSCNNLPSAEWLKSTAPLLEDWTDAEIAVVDPTDIPQRSTLVMTIPGPAEVPEHILERLERQNKGIKASEWNIIDQKKTENGQMLYVCVDNTVIPELKKIDYNPFLNFTRVKIKRLGKYKPRERKNVGNGKSETVEGEEVSTAEDGNDETANEVVADAQEI